MADENRDVELEQLSHLEWDLVCEILHVVSVATLFGRVTKAATRPCGRPAEWIAMCRACGSFGYLCDADRQSKPKLVCGKCWVQAEMMFDFTRIPPAEVR